MEITKGDNKSFKFQRKTKSGEVITDLPDEIYITFKPNAYDEKALFQKRLGDNTITFENNYYIFEIVPEDTDNLDYETYYYDIELILDGKKKTIHKGELVITEQYTFPANEVE